MRALWINGKAVILDSGFCVLNELFEMRMRVVYGSVLIKIGAIGLGGFMEVALTINSGQNIFMMWDILLVNVLR